MKITILGCYSATPRKLANTTAQVLEIRGELLLIDCGEGTQLQLRKSKIKFSRIQHIFVSHLHGDHFFGLPGLISTFRLLGRKTPLHIYGPTGIKKALQEFMKPGRAWPDYPIEFREISENKPVNLLETEKFSVTTLPLDHRIYTNGFLFREKPLPRKLDVKRVEQEGIDKSYYRKLTMSQDVKMTDGRIYKWQDFTFDPPKPLSYAFCSDTRFKPDLVPLIKEVTVLYHESTFTNKHLELSTKTGHSTAAQAAEIAKRAGVKTLILGHYSTRYKELSEFGDEAAAIFRDVRLAEDGKIFSF